MAGGLEVSEPIYTYRLYREENLEFPRAYMGGGARTQVFIKRDLGILPSPIGNRERGHSQNSWSPRAYVGGGEPGIIPNPKAHIEEIEIFLCLKAHIQRRTCTRGFPIMTGDLGKFSRMWRHRRGGRRGCTRGFGIRK